MYQHHQQQCCRYQILAPEYKQVHFFNRSIKFSIKYYFIFLIFVLLTIFVKCIGLTAQNSSLSGSVNSNGNNNNLSGVSGIRECAGCCKRITERFLLKALDLYWHEDCLKCGCCDCRLGEVGSTLYTKANLILCKRDYLR